ncbi:MAG TPA: DUF262 domain-containing HNH endonuclease family protein [Archangium sp.]|uniref:DUF262 domain-containing protein n=1 Tax=Archangium sp. TaxID=1872627 RepID=UPI002E317FC9|nr:DUF262 domain-containing HNH endonuclease family protein [Archangium sp.]HEX5751730.1 DUF262 domain-containing HNH endonuclease family protein [Archangium sp.]
MQKFRITIEGRQLPIEDVFNEKFLFQIPEYQRPYSWELEHAVALFEDLRAALGEGTEQLDYIAPYFLGSIVLIKDERPASYVVDGQQRLTTLTILLSVLRSLFPQSQASKLDRFLYQPGDEFTGLAESFRLRVRDDDRDFFQEYVQRPGGIDKVASLDPKVLKLETQRRIRANTLALYDSAKKLSDDARLRLTRYLLTRCFLVVVSTPDLDAAYRIFSVLNDRGLDLSHADILKAEIVGGIPTDDRPTFAKKWEAHENRLGRTAFNDLFAHIRMIHARTKLKGTVLKEFREVVVTKYPDPAKLIDSELLPMAEAYEDLLTASFTSSEHADEINQLLSWMLGNGERVGIENVDWIPPALRCLAAYRRAEPSPFKESAAVLRFLRDLERLAAGMMFLRNNINDRIRRYGQLLEAMERGDDLYADTSPLQFTADEQTRILSILDGNLYEEQRIRLYVLLRLDQTLSDGSASYDYPVITVEHVLPRNPPSNSQWRTLFNDAQRSAFVHRLGNLALLSRRKNSEASNLEFTPKKAKYLATAKSGGSPFVLTSEVLHESTWTPAVVEARQKRLLAKLTSLWRLTPMQPSAGNTN